MTAPRRPTAVLPPLLALVSSIVALVVPKCPLCFLAISAACGVSLTTFAGLRFPLTLLCLATALLLLMRSARAQQRYATFALAAAAAVGITVAEWLASPSAALACSALLVACTLWNGRRTRGPRLRVKPSSQAAS